MAKRNIKVVIIKVFGSDIDPKMTTVKPVVKEIEPTLATYYKEIGCDYKEIGCDCIDIVTRYINGKAFDVICDDEAFLKDCHTLTSRDKDFESYLVGNLIICRQNRGEEIGLTDIEIAQVLGALDENNVLVTD